ncbi:S8 family serine peptidase [Motilimonas sp. KMU-193]|uniref:S8 family serine peptidase n=1 Tax=Motilimonas sp. KMU-193 TaxID=3388668 RepID=UPI00396B27AF
MRQVAGPELAEPGNRKNTQDDEQAQRSYPLPEMEQFWQLTKGAGVRVAVIDDGFDLNHPALQKLNTVVAVDVTRGVMDAAPQSRQDTHGTKVAGILFAQHQVDGLAVPKVLGLIPDSEAVLIRLASSWTTDIINAFLVAGSAEADIINCSWSVKLNRQPIADVIASLALNGRGGKGTLIVFAAGNQAGELTKHDLAATEYALTVAAVDQQGQLVGAWGDSVDLAARTQLPTTQRSDIFKWHYTTLGYTSGAAPLVAGTAGLLLARHPNLTAQQVITRLKQSVTHKDELDLRVRGKGLFEPHRLLSVLSSDLPDKTNNE